MTEQSMVCSGEWLVQVQCSRQWCPTNIRRRLINQSFNNMEDEMKCLPSISWMRRRYGLLWKMGVHCPLRKTAWWTAMALLLTLAIALVALHPQVADPEPAHCPDVRTSIAQYLKPNSDTLRSFCTSEQLRVKQTK